MRGFGAAGKHGSSKPNEGSPRGAPRSLCSKEEEHFYSCSRGEEAPPRANALLFEYMRMTR